MEGTMNIEIIRALGDNFIYLVETTAGAVVIDPGDAAPVERALAERGLRLSMILVTHEHHDHTGGIAALKQRSGALVAGPAGGRIPELDRIVGEGDVIEAGEGGFTVLATPGHGAHDVSYVLHRPDHPDALFCGDTLFVSGCGRIFGADAQQLWQSLDRLRRLPELTAVYCGHDYTEENLRFALSVEPDDAAYAERLCEFQAAAAAGRPCVPSTIGMERRANPFLRCRDAATFARLRAMKDRFG